MSRKKSDLKVLFLGKAGDPHTLKAFRFLEDAFHENNITPRTGEWGDPLPDSVREWQGDVIISYLSRWVVPQATIDRASKYAINFHPGPPAYPGIGCVNFALFDEVDTYGTTVHFMNEDVDTGTIISATEFTIFENDSVESLLARTYDIMYAQFTIAIDRILSDTLEAGEGFEWVRDGTRDYTREEFEKLMEIDITDQGLALRDRENLLDRLIRATSYGEFQPYIMIHGRKFVYQPEKK